MKCTWVEIETVCAETESLNLNSSAPGTQQSVFLQEGAKNHGIALLFQRQLPMPLSLLLVGGLKETNVYSQMGEFMWLLEKFTLPTENTHCQDSKIYLRRWQLKFYVR